MSALTAVRESAAVLGATGVVTLLAPLERPVRPVVRRAVGLVLVLASWGALAASLLPSDALSSLASPARVVAAVLALAAIAGATVLLVRLILSRPWVWLVLLAVVLPIRIPLSIGGEDANLLVPLYAVLLLGLVAWLWGRARGRLRGEGEPTTPLDLPIAAFVALTLVSTLWSDDSSEAAIKAVFFYLPFVLLYLLVVAWWREAGTTPALKALALATIAMAVPVAALTVGQYLTRDIFWNERLMKTNVYGRFFRANGIFFDPNVLGRYLMVAMLAAVAIACLSRSTRVMLAMGGACAVMGAGLALTFSRSSALGLMVGVALIALRAFGWRRTLAVGGTLIVLLGTIAVVESRNVRRALTSTERIEKVSEGRFDLVKGGLSIWRDAPVLGTGLGSFAVRYEETLTPVERQRIRVVISHNAPVTVLSEVGAVGFALFLILLACGASSLVRAARAPGSAGFTAWTCLAIVAGIVMHSLFYSALFEDPYTWVVVAVGIALGVTPRPEPAAPAPTPSEPVPVG